MQRYRNNRIVYGPVHSVGVFAFGRCDGLQSFSVSTKNRGRLRRHCTDEKHQHGSGRPSMQKDAGRVTCTNIAQMHRPTQLFALLDSHASLLRTIHLRFQHSATISVLITLCLLRLA